MKKLFLTVSVLFFTMLLFAQNGTIRGTVIDKDLNETIIGASVLVKNTTKGASTDLDGQFSISIEPGTYSVEISFIGLQKITIEDVVVTAGKVNSLPKIYMSEDSEVLGGVVITAEAIRNNEAAMQLVKKESVAMLDGVSSEKMEIAGAGSAAEAAKSVTGVSVEGGKYVFVRGLGDRYTKTTLNGMFVPGLDPDKNTVQMDIFPSSLINNIAVSKNFTANLPADFTGGLVNIETKDFPEQKFSKLSIGVGFNPSMHFNDDYLYYKGGKTDFLGFDDGTRALPNGAASEDIPRPIASPDQEVNDFVNSFNKTLSAERKMSLMDMSIGYSLGDQLNLKNKQDEETGNTLGYLFSVSYKNSTDYYSEALNGNYQLSPDRSNNEMDLLQSRNGEYGQNNVLVGLQGGLAYKTKLSKYRFTAMHIQNGEKKAGKYDLVNEGNTASGWTGYSDNLEYTQRSLTNLLLNGTHKTEDKKWEVNWATSYTLSVADDPDVRSTPFTINESGTIQVNPNAAGSPVRIWRTLNEFNINAKVDVTRKHQLFGNDSKFLFGVNELYKERDYNIVSLEAKFWEQNLQSWENYEANEILYPQYIYPNLPNGTYYRNTITGGTNPNQYNANVNNFAFYVSEEAKITRRLKAILGVRAEYYIQNYTGSSQQKPIIVLDNERVLDNLDFFPSLNLIYALNEKQNLRGAISRTIARPSFKELSYAQILDPLTGWRYNGGFIKAGDWDGNLVSTYVQNADLRWELFMEKAQTVSFSAFYKGFTDAIELVRVEGNIEGTDFQSRNVGDAFLYGFEFEFKKNLDFISDKFEKLSFNGNITMLQSEIKMTETEFKQREEYARDGETIKNTRQMAGQSPYVINAGINYADNDNGFNAGLFYNVKGKTLTSIGNGLFPDVYSEPFHSLNLGLSKKLGENKNTTVKLNVDNLLNDKRQMFYQSYKSSDQIFSSINPGTAISLGASFKF